MSGQPSPQPPSPLSPEELERYSRHLRLEGFGLEAQLRLRGARVLVVGAGGLGCPALLHLAAAGVGTLTVVDDDTVALSNLQRQTLFTLADVGAPKALAARTRLLALNNTLRVEAIVGRLDTRNALELARAHDVVIDGSDNYPTRYLVNDACVLAGRPFVHGAVQGFEGQVAVFNWRGGPTYRCLFPAPPPAGATPSCAVAGVLGVLPGIIGTQQAVECVKLLAGIGVPLSGRVWLYDALSARTTLLSLGRTERAQVMALLPSYDEAPCAAGESDAMELPVSELRVLLAGRSAPPLLDVREPWERALGAINPSVHIPLGELSADRLPPELRGGGGVVVYCAKGGRSLKAVHRLSASGVEARSLRGGFEAWTAQA
jgi:adenylyltransferase/sulfurtransferase